MRDIASEMNALFATIKDYCDYDNGDPGDKSRPSFLCSGIIIRTATPGPTWNVWDIDAKTLTETGAGGVSFSWLRQDSTFGDLGSSGLTMFPLFGPYNAHDSNDKVVKYECAFVFDAWTNMRDQKGCGSNPSMYYTEGKPCQTQGIMTGPQWVAHFLQTPGGYKTGQSYFYQCGFNVWSDGDGFLAAVRARGLMASYDSSYTYNDRNELRAENWPIDGNGIALYPQELPIQSFYYVNGSGSVPRLYAVESQKAYYEKTGKTVPVIRVTPQNNGYFFEQLPTDQFPSGT
ncbi:hypothetical protein RO07_20980 [Pandoraea pulmonicola]|nr:hypothetical protein RO07_20980 [Pandoraea pulmonicola]